MSAFCAEHSISRKTFYALRHRAVEYGQAAVLEPRSRRPKSSPTKIPEEIQQRALEVRASLEASGLDHGPISVHDKMLAMGMAAPSEASLARIFRSRGSRGWSRRRSPVRRIAGSSIPRRTRAGSSTPPSTCWPGAAGV